MLINASVLALALAVASAEGTEPAEPVDPAGAAPPPPAAPSAAPALAASPVGAERLTAIEEAPLVVALEASAVNAENTRIIGSATSIGLGVGVLAYHITTYALVAAAPDDVQASDQRLVSLFSGSLFGGVVTANGIAGLIVKSQSETRLEAFEAASHDTDEQRFRRAADVLNGMQKSDRDYEDARIIGNVLTIAGGAVMLGTAALFAVVDVYGRDPNDPNDASLSTVGYVFAGTGAALIGAGIANVAYGESEDHAALEAIGKMPALKSALDVP